MTGLVQIPYWWHATIFEIMWLISGLVGGVITVANLADSYGDRDVLSEIRDDPAVHETHYRMIELAAKGREESQWVRLVICALITASGAVGVLTANPLKGGTTWTGFVVTITLILIAVLTAAKSWRDYQHRDKMMALAMQRTSVTAARMKAAEARRRRQG